MIRDGLLIGTGALSSHVVVKFYLQRANGNRLYRCGILASARHLVGLFVASTEEKETWE